jgi:hypothetical protein
MNMRILSSPFRFSSLAVLAFGASFVSAQGFSIAAGNVVLSGSAASTQYTVTGIPITGTVMINCTNATPIDPPIKTPYCNPGLPPHAIQVVAGQTLTGVIQFYASPVPLPASFVFWPVALLLGLTLRKRRRWMLLSTTINALVVAMAISGCGGNSNGLPPGTYPFTVSAVNSAASGQGPSYLAQTTVTVKVP